MAARDPSAPPSARPAPERPIIRDAPRANETRLPQAPGTIRIPDPTPALDADDERIRRYEQAMSDPQVKDLLKRFEADVIAREPGDAQTWQDRLKRS